MGLITKEVEVGLSSINLRHYEELKYEIPKSIGSKGRLIVPKGTKIRVKVEDLTNSSAVFVEVKCDGCEKPSTEIKWGDYLRCVKDDGKYYCHDCSMKLNGRENYKKTRLKNGKSFYQWCYDNLPKELADWILDRWDYKLNKISPKDVNYGSKGIDEKGYWFKCFLHPEHESELKNINSFTGNQSKTITCNQCNCINTTHPYLTSFLVNKNDALLYSMGSDVKIPMKCPDCGCEKAMRIPTLIRNGFSCPRCSDGVSYPQKFLFSVFEQLLDKDFQTELSKTTFKWCKNYKYDFYINKLNGIIETHGEQHYIDNLKSNWKMSLEETEDNDFDKEWLARENKINNYIILDCRKSELEWIKNSIMNSRLTQLLNFKEEDINWLKCHEYACKSLVKFICDMWNSGFKSVSKIINEYKIGESAVRRYLKQGVELGWCDYNPKEEMKRKEHINKKVICLTTGKVYQSIIIASEECKVSPSTISACCRKKDIKLAYRDFETQEKMVWMYHYDYILKTKDEIRDIFDNAKERNQKIKKIKCLTTGEIFKSQTEASDKYNIDVSSITKCCKGKQKYAGKHPVTNQEMVWEYYK